METKKCKKCSHVKVILEYYKNPNSKDGYSEKCKECAKSMAQKNYFLKSKDEKFVEQERIRGRDKYRRLYVGTKSAHEENKNTRKFLKSKGINLTGLELHHWNYNNKNDVFILDRKAHKLVHKFIEYDVESKLFVYDGKKLNSKDSHLEVIIKIFNQNHVEYEIGFYPLKKPRA